MTIVYEYKYFTLINPYNERASKNRISTNKIYYLDNVSARLLVNKLDKKEIPYQVLQRGTNTYCIDTITGYSLDSPPQFLDSNGRIFGKFIRHIFSFLLLQFETVKESWK